MGTNNAQRTDVPMTCARVVDEAKDLICNKPVFEEIWVRNKFGRYSVALCRECRQEHLKFYDDDRRATEASRASKQATQPRGRMTSGTPYGSNPGPEPGPSNKELRPVSIENDNRPAEPSVRVFLRGPDLRETVQADRTPKARFSSPTSRDDRSQVY